MIFDLKRIREAQSSELLIVFYFESFISFTTILQNMCPNCKDPKRMKATSFAFLIVILSVFGCESETAQPVNTLGSEVELSMTEFVDEDQRTLTLKFLTRKDFPCINYRIKHSLAMDNQSINIILEKIEEADVCLDAIGPASAFVELGYLPEKEYNLTVQLGESIVKSGTLTVSKNAYQVEMHDFEGVELLNPELLRVPEQSVWGLLKYERNDKNKKLVEHFEQVMDRAGATDKKFAEGDYGYFKVGADGKIHRDVTNKEVIVEQPFLFDFSGDSDDLKMVLKQINNEYEEVQIRIYDARGHEFRNWELN